jgi:hypothetical protein
MKEEEIYIKIEKAIKERAEKDKYGQTKISSCTLANLFPGDIEFQNFLVEFTKNYDKKYALSSYSSCITREDSIYKALTKNRNY